MNKLSFVFEAPDDMTARQARLIIEQAIEWAASDYAACQKENDKYPTEDDEYQKKYDALDSLTLMDVEPVDYIDDYWSEDNDYPSEDWQFEVTNDDTRQGYWDWVKSQKEMEEEDGSTDNH